LEPGPTLVIGASEIVLTASESHYVFVVDWNRRRLAKLDQFARERGKTVRFLCRDPEKQDLGIAARSLKNIVCLDVLERFHDDLVVLDKLQQLLQPGGKLVVRVRACPWVQEEAGRVPGSPRFYDAESLRSALQAAAFRTLRMRHWNALGVPTALLWDRFLHRPHRDEGGIPASERPRHWWDTALDLWFRTVENRMGFPMGVSLVAVATPFLEKARVRREEFDRGFVRRRSREAYEPMPLSR
jgi:SAM-dependent methyltransferase